MIRGSYWKGKSMKNKMKLKVLALSSLVWISSISFAHSDYCIALRGNGELKPAHWGALAQTVEVFGVPKAMAGGSSASISTFLVESILLNPHLGTDLTTKSRDLAFLIKSFEGFIYTYTDRSEYQHFFEVLRTVQGIDDERGLIARLRDLVMSKSTSELVLSYKDIKSVINDIRASEVFYGPQVHAFYKTFSEYLSGLKSVISIDKWNALKSEHQKLKLSLAVFGKFDAKNDQTIFVRDGIISFPALAKVFDFMANFYSLRGATAETEQLFIKFIQSCAPGSEGLGWRELTKQKPICQTLLADSVLSFAKAHDQANPRMNDPVGKYLPTLVSTSVVVGNSRRELLSLKKSYLKSTAGKFDFQLPDENLKFGYWGQDVDLEAVSQYFMQRTSEPAAQIDKSKKFMSLGSAPWSYVLEFSPAEPGLSSMLPFKANGEDYISLGGWSDLHPVPILKAKGCEKVVFVTRKGGESIFAQGIAKRLLGFPKLPWSELDPADSDENQTQALNNRGRIGETDGKWSQMFNLANPKSSFSVSLQLADAVVCTDWNAFDVTKNFRGLIDEAYAAPIYLAQPMDMLALKAPKLITKDDNGMVARLAKSGQPLQGQTYPKYSGCILGY